LLRFFKSSLPAQLVALLLLVLALRLPLLWLGLPLTAAELRALLVGERLHAGAMPYRDLYDGTAPLAAAFFAGLETLASRPIWLYRIVALTLLVIQALRLNAVFNRYDVHPERGYIGALTYLLLGSVSTDLDTLSPLLLGHTFIVFSLSALLSTSREGYDNRRLFRAGFLVGLAALCYLPLGLFVALALFAIIVFAANAFRSFLLFLCGVAFPYALVATYFFYNNALPGFVRFHFEAGLADMEVDALPGTLQLGLLALPALVLVLALLRAGTVPLGLVFQTKFRQLMLVWLLVAIVTGAVGQGAAAGAQVLILPPLAYFGLFLWQKARLRWLPELFLLVVLAATVTLRYRAQVPGLETLLRLPAESRFGMEPDPALAQLQGHRILVLGDDNRAYLSNKLATPYLDWELAQDDFGRLGEYAAVVRIARQVGADPPAYLVDQVGLLPWLQRRVPGVFDRYEPTIIPRVFRRKPTP
jgi:hypothetical protein